MADITLPTPLALAGGALCLLGGYVIGVVAGPQTADQTVATVQGYDEDTRELCLTGDTVTEEDGAVDGVLCGEWRRAPGAATPQEGDRFRFVTIERAEGGESTVYVLGEVVGEGS